MSRVRLDRTNRLILSTVNELLLTKTKDPRLFGVTVTKAIVSGDLSTVRLFYSLIGDGDRISDAEKALGKATGFIRSRLASTLDRKHTPKLIFERDLNPGHAQRVGELLNSIAPAAPEADPAGAGPAVSAPAESGPDEAGPEAR
ncbi:MAG: 30S ribosome-binding factor RbfA [Deltaproteobacteria bacterium]|jgi:ribosome-binding factor A|nr:30S ribosome-binding factor RbfA [Deltaproteobacteria bacterium]